LKGATFDRILSVNSIYFWRDVEAVLSKITQALAPGGKLALAFRPDGDDVPERFRDPTYRFPRLEVVKGTLERLGLTLEGSAPTVAPGIVLLVASKLRLSMSDT
jgi:SAM-dependent methyltransferase